MIRREPLPILLPPHAAHIAVYFYLTSQAVTTGTASHHCRDGGLVVEVTAGGLDCDARRKCFAQSKRQTQHLCDFTRSWHIAWSHRPSQTGIYIYMRQEFNRPINQSHYCIWKHCLKVCCTQTAKFIILSPLNIRVPFSKCVGSLLKFEDMLAGGHNRNLILQQNIALLLLLLLFRL